MVYRNGFKGKHGDNLLKLSKKEKKDSPINPVSSLTRRNRDFPNPAPSIARHNRDDNPGPKGKESHWRVWTKNTSNLHFQRDGILTGQIERKSGPERVAGKDSLLGPRHGRKGMETGRWMEPRLISASGDLLEVYFQSKSNSSRSF